MVLKRLNLPVSLVCLDGLLNFHVRYSGMVCSLFGPGWPRACFLHLGSLTRPIYIYICVCVGLIRVK